MLKQRALELEDISGSIRQFCHEHPYLKEAQDLMKTIIQQQALGMQL
jgi:hypothetical protein